MNKIEINLSIEKEHFDFFSFSPRLHLVLVFTRNSRNMFATIMETTLNEAPMTPVTGLWGMNVGGLPFSHLYSDMSCILKTKEKYRTNYWEWQSVCVQERKRESHPDAEYIETTDIENNGLLKNSACTFSYAPFPMQSKHWTKPEARGRKKNSNCKFTAAHFHYSLDGWYSTKEVEGIVKNFLAEKLANGAAMNFPMQ